MERVNNNDFRRKSHTDKLQYLKDCDDDNFNDHRSIKKQLRTIIGFLSAIFLMMSGYMFDQIFLG